MEKNYVQRLLFQQCASLYDAMRKKYLCYLPVKMHALLTLL